MTELVSPLAFKWFLTLFTGIVAGVWFVWDAIKLVRLRTADGTDPVVRDKRFGYAIGVAIGAIGVIGCLKFNNVI
jgi:hypothetical protein